MRYKAVAKSGHPCCWHASIEDTTELDSNHNPITICECENMEMAEKIASVLNHGEAVNDG